jgi:hypothetical protein
MNGSSVSVEKIEAENLKNGYILSVPYIKITGGKALLKNDDGYYLPTGDEEYEEGEIVWADDT